MNDSPINRIFTDGQLMSIGAALASDAAKGAAIRYLYDEWGIRLMNEVHDSWVLEVPDTLTKEDGDIIFTELMVLVR